MATLPSTKTVTYEQWLTMPEVSDAIEEVVNGEIRIMPPPKWKHARVIHALELSINHQVDPKKVIALTTKFGLVIRKSPLTCREPDLAVFDLDSVIERDGYVHSAPQLVVVVLSGANTPALMRDKLGDYAELGVPEVWVVNPDNRTVQVHYLEHGRLRPVSTVPPLKPRAFPHVEIDIDQIWPA